MTTRARIAITAGSALALGITAFGYQWSFGGLDAPESQLWGVGFLVAYGLGLLGVFVVDRCWALLPSLSTSVVYLTVAAIHPHMDQWSSESIPLTPSTGIGFLILLIGVNTAFLSIGLLARRLWDHLIRPGWSRAFTKGSDRCTSSH